MAVPSLNRTPTLSSDNIKPRPYFVDLSTYRVTHSDGGVTISSEFASEPLNSRGLLCTESHPASGGNKLLLRRSCIFSRVLRPAAVSTRACSGGWVTTAIAGTGICDTGVLPTADVATAVAIAFDPIVRPLDESDGDGAPQLAPATAGRETVLLVALLVDNDREEERVTVGSGAFPKRATRGEVMMLRTFSRLKGRDDVFAKSPTPICVSPARAACRC